MPPPEVARAAAALAGGRELVLRIPAHAARRDASAPASEPEPVPSIGEQWIKLWLERDADMRAEVGGLKKMLHERLALDTEKEREAADARIARLEETQRLLMDGLQRITDGQAAIAKLLAAEVVPTYDAKGKLKSARRVVT